MAADIQKIADELAEKGYVTIDNFFTGEETDRMIETIEAVDTSDPVFRKTGDLFAIRQFLKAVPEIGPLVMNMKLRELIRELFGNGYFVVKSIYFDKPEQSNWFVAWHQDLTISVDKKITLDGFGPWTVKQGQFAVQPPVEILEHIFTLRIHLDDTDEHNGALRVIPGSHLRGICRPENLLKERESDTHCKINKGGMMFMRPLLMHSSGRTTNQRKRRVIHIEFCDLGLPGGLGWAEYVVPGETAGRAQFSTSV